MTPYTIFKSCKKRRDQMRYPCILNMILNSKILNSVIQKPFIQRVFSVKNIKEPPTMPCVKNQMI